ncbi:flavodoxin domain-containing protein [Olsenella sp. YH-ols2221]|jgi:flavodoxin|uniref:flavodoxin family protein n=1 Tax=Olsenella kribbiana TaxID=3115221 RepID=UPI002A87E1C6|nr:flavodoxin domain-containing protein [Atopobiaceae bacterium]
MKCAVRYYSRSGNTRLLAEAIADELGVEAVSADSSDATISGHIDVLFIGGALYAYGLDKKLVSYIRTLDGDMVGRAVLFSTTWLSKHSFDQMRKELEARGIVVAERTFYAKNKPSAERLKEAKAFADDMAK